MRKTLLPLLPLLLLAACHSASDDHATSTSAATDDGTKILDAVSPIRAMGPSSSSQMRPALATDGTDFLSAWVECGGNDDVWECRIRAARIDRAGKVLDDASLDLPHVPGTFDTAPAIAFDGTNYLVAWEHDHLKNDADPGGIEAVRISKSGKLLDTDFFELGSRGGQPAVASSGSGWTVAWTERDAHELHATRLDANGQKIVDDVTLASTSTWNNPPSLALESVGTTLLLAWDYVVPGATSTEHGHSEIHAVRLDATSLDFLDPQPLDIAVDSDDWAYPQIASDGSRFLIAWNALGGYGTSARFVNSDGTLEQTQTLATGGQYGRIAFDGQAFVLADTAAVTTFARQDLAQENRNERDTNRPIPVVDYKPLALASTPTGSLVLHRELAYGAFPINNGRPLAGDLYDLDLTKSSTVVRPSRVSATAAHVVSARNGDERLVVWHEYRRDWNRAEIRGALVKADGQLAEESSFLIRATDAHGCSDPSVVFDGTDYVVAWNESSGDEPAGVGVVHLNAKGGVIGEPVIRGAGRDPKLVVAGNDVVAMFADGSVIKVDDGFIHPTQPKLFSIDAQMDRELLFDGTGFVAVWRSFVTESATTVKMQRFALDGTPVADALPLAKIPMSDPFHNATANVAAATDGHGKTLVAWDDPEGGRFIDGLMIDGDAVTAPVHLTSGGPADTVTIRPAVAFDGSEWLIASEASHLRDDHSQLQLSRLSADGKERVGNAKTLVKGRGRGPAFSADDKGRAIVTYTLDGAVKVQAYSYTPGSSEPPPSGDDDDSTTKDPKTKPTPAGADDDGSTTTETPKNPDAPKSTVSVNAGCSSTAGSSSNGFALVMLAVAAAIAGRRRRTNA